MRCDSPLVRKLFLCPAGGGGGGRLFCARDHFGIKTFYYSLLPDGRLLCATDISKIAADAGYRKAIDPDALQLYMMFGYPAGEATLFRGIRKLMPGCSLTWDAGVCRVEQYYRPAFHPEYGVREQDWIDRIDGTLQDILDDDRATAGLCDGSAFLFGGVDFALLLPYADRRMFELSAAIPSDLKWRDGCGKYILRRTAE